MIHQILAASISDIDNPALWLSDWSGGQSTQAGVSVSPESSLSLSAYYACIRSISEDIAKLPLSVHRRVSEREREPAIYHPAHDLVHSSPNEDTTAMTFWESLIANALAWGNGYATIKRDTGGRPLELRWTHPSRVEVTRAADGNVLYIIDSGRTPEESALGMFHLRGPGDELTGWSILRMAAESLGLSMAAEMFGASYFGNGARVSGVLEHPMTMSAEAQKRLTEQFSRDHGGPKNAHKPKVLEEGMKWTQTGIPPEESQFLETRQFQVEEIARWFRMPPHKIQHLLRATFSNIEAQSIEYVVDTLMPWAVRIEQETKRKLLRKADGDLFVKHNFNSLLRGDSAARADFYAKRFSIGTLSQNDIRALEDENPIGPDGDVYYVPVNNMAPSAQAATGIATPGVSGPGAVDDESTIALANNTFQSVFVDIAERLLLKEEKAAARARKRGSDELGAWAEKFFAERVSEVRDSFRPALTSWSLLSGKDYLSAIRLFSGSWCAQSRREALGQVDSQSAKARVKQLVELLS